MIRLFRFAGLLPALLITVPLFGADKLVNPDKPGEDPKIRAKLLQAEYLTGKLTSIEGEGDDKTYILEVPQKAKSLNTAMRDKYNELLKQYQDAVSKKDAGRAQQITGQMAEVNSKLYDLVDVPYEFSLKSDKDLILRRSKLMPKEAGDDGKVPKYTEEELKALKGDDAKIPGYKADPKDLINDTLVKVYLDKNKIKATPAKDKKKDEPDDIITYTVKMMVILPPPENTALGGDPKDPKVVEIKEDPKFRAKLAADPYIEGKLVKVDLEDEKGSILEVIEKRKTPNPEQAKRYTELSQKRLQVKNANELKQVDDQLKDCMSKYYDVKDVPYQFQLETTKEVKVRQLKLPAKEPGKDGKPGKYTPEELKELKGDDAKLVGYKFDPKELGTDMIVRVFIDRTKFKAPPKPKPGEEPSDEIVSYPITIILVVPPPEEKPNGGGLLPPGFGK